MDLSLRTGNLIGGTWESTETTIDVLNPATGEPIIAVANASVGDCLRAVDAAHHAFESWRNVAPRARGEILRRAFEMMMADQERLATIITLEIG